MSQDLGQVVIVGAGPAGVSAAWALCERGIPVTLLDAGTTGPQLPPAGDYLQLRFDDPEQWRWQLGATFSSFDAPLQASPKLRVPGLRRVFEGYAQANRLHPQPGFHLVGALSAGGLSNAWGAGVACFDEAELGPLAGERHGMRDAYARVARRTGLSGASDDALQAYFGLDPWTQPALPMDRLHAHLWQRRERAGSAFSIGRARVAVLNQARRERSACDLSGMCLWGCARRAIWSAGFELDALRRHAGFDYLPGVRVQRLQATADGGWTIESNTALGEPRTFVARHVLLATGTIATTRLVLDALPDPPAQVRLLSNPMAAFLLCLPTMLGRTHERGFGLAQLSLLLERAHGAEAAMANLFSTAGLPVSEFLNHLPVRRRAGLPLLRALLPATVVGNVFLPGSLSAHVAGLDDTGGLWIRGGGADALPDILSAVRRRLTGGFRKLGAWMLPGSFVPAGTGADLHYAGTLPIREQPAAHECRLDGRVAGLPGLYVLDGAALPMLPAKAHTLTIMANADRIARGLVTG